jgi:hypothetical protein
MSVGSAFDAYIKSYLYEYLYGKDNDDFNFETLFNRQVEDDHKEFARIAGKKCMDAYRISGALSDLVLMLEHSNAKFEFTAVGEVTGKIGEAILLGKPDAYFTKQGTDIILDWKVNGYCSKASPAPGYLICRDGWTGSKNSRSHGKSHPDCIEMNKGGVPINVAMTLDKCKGDWASQTAIYSWLCGSQVGSDFIVAIDQLACDGCDKIRIAEHRSLVDPKYQWALYDECQKIWEIIHSDWIFREMSREESANRCQVLDQQAAALVNADPWFTKVTR